jgi:hypothetical protein
MNSLILGFALLLLACISPHGLDVIIYTTFVRVKSGAVPVVKSAAYLLEHLMRIQCPVGSSFKALIQPEGNTNSPDLLLTSGAECDSLSTYRDLERLDLDSGKYELTYTVEPLHSTSGGGVMRMELSSDAWIQDDSDKLIQRPQYPIWGYCRADGISQTLRRIFSVFPVGNIYDAKFAYDLNKPLQPSDPASPLKNSIVMFTIDGDDKVVGGDVLAMKKTPSQVAGPHGVSDPIVHLLRSQFFRMSI